MKQAKQAPASAGKAIYSLLVMGLVWVFIPLSVKAQWGTGITDAIPAGTFGACVSTPFIDDRNNTYYDGVEYVDNYNNYTYDDYGAQPSPDVWYTFTILDYSDIVVSTCGSSLDTYVHLLDIYGNQWHYNDDYYNCGRQSYMNYTELPPGVYYVVVEGKGNSTGDFTVSISGSSGGSPSAGANMSNAINAGYFTNSGSYSDTRSNADACMGNNYNSNHPNGQASNDIYYKFSLSRAATVKLSHCGSGFDTYMHLLNISGTRITSVDDATSSPCPGTQAYMEVSLQAGTYYVVSEGYSTNAGNIVTGIEVQMSSSIAIAYPASSYTFPTGTPVTTLNPTVSGGTLSFDKQFTSTYAGNGSGGLADGAASTSSFDWPLGVAMDQVGNLYVADSRNQRIRKVSAGGVVSSLAGSYAGYQNGTGSNALFRNPIGLAIDAQGNVYVVDQQNHCIRKITPAGVVTTFAGNGTAGYANGTGTSARFNGPAGICIDVSGNLYISDSGNNRIRKITPAGVVSTYAGTGVAGATNGAATSASFKDPRGLVLDAAGNLIVCDRQNHLMRKISPSGVVSTLAGSGVTGWLDGAGTAARFGGPHGVAMDESGNLYVVDQNGNNMIRKISPDGIVSTFAGSPSIGSTDGTGSAVLFNTPYGICSGPGGVLYVADTYNHKIRKMVTRAFTISPELPAGLVFNYANGSISGTPTGPSPATTYTVSTYNGAQATLSITVSGPPPLSPSQNQNYIITYTPREAELTTSEAVVAASSNKDAVQTTIAYFDGLGRPLQTVQARGSADGSKDIVIPNQYDAFGREAKKYLPYASASNNGSYKADALTAGAGVFSYYNPSGSGSQLPSGVPRIPTPFAETVFEPSPLNRIEEQRAPGEAWKIGSGHTVRTEYTTNNSTAFNPSATAGSKRVALYSAEVENDGVRKLTRANNTAIYANNQLYVTILKDENWAAADGCIGTTEEYKDKEGRVVLKRTYNKKGSVTEMLSTYYVYDDFGNLCFVLPPLSEPDADAAISIATLNNLCYQYRYDHRNRVTGKKLPGKHWEFIIYNKLDQVVMSQDGNQRNKSPQEWTVSKYDGLGRLVMTGIYQDAGSAADNNILPSDSRRAALQTSVNNQASPLWEERYNHTSSDSTGYTNRTFPLTTISSYLTIHYYDDYEFPGGNPYTATGSSMTRSLLTGSRSKILKGSIAPGTDEMLWSVNYYDDKGRVSKSFQQHYKGGTIKAGNVDEVSNTYSFTGELTSATRIHKVEGVQKLKTFIRHTYDHMGRLVKTDQQINSDPQVVLAQNEYNEIGQLKEKKLHNGSQSTRYTYNPRGWLKSSSSDQFAMELKYEDGRAPQYNGNISDQYWGAGSNLTKDYAYRYDRLNRLVSGIAKDGMSEKEISYDKGGNILGLQRYISNTAAEDKLKYSYSGNQLSTVYDSVGSTNVLYQLTGTTSYSYDKNGNMISRINTANSANNISSMSYNLLNLPQSVSLPNSNTLSYVYDAAGNKLRKIAGSTITEYIGGIQYTGNTIDFVQTPEGRAIPNGNSYKYEYNLQDHLGNNRYSFDLQSSGISKLQEDDYYPFGLRISRQVSSQANKYLYNGKELQDELNQYDYGARFYDPVIARWNVIDRLTEKYVGLTPYHYGANNPVLNVDINGDSIWVVHKGNQILYENGNVYNKDGSAYTGPGVKTKKDGTTKLTGFLKSAVNGLNDIRMGGNAGNELIGNLQSSSKNIFIRESSGKNDNSGFMVSWNPSNMDSGPDQNGQTGRPAFIGLTHELAHAWDWADDGKVDTRTWITMSDGKAIPNAEHYASHWENMIRGENGLSLRAFYGIDNGAGVGRVLIPSTRMSPNYIQSLGPIVIPYFYRGAQK